MSDFIATVITGIVVFRELKRYTPKTEKLNENERLNEITTE